MKSISSFGSNNQNPINDREGLTQSNNYQAGYLAKDNKCDEVTFTGNKKDGVKAKGFKGLLIALAATLGLSGCTPAINNKDVKATNEPQTAITETVENVSDADLQFTDDSVALLDLNSNVPVVSIVATKKIHDEEVEVKRYPNALAIKDDMFHDGKEYNSTTHVVKTASNEQDECSTLLEAINKQYADPFIHNGGDPGDFTGADLDQIAREIIEGNEDMQKKIAEHYGVDNWMEADIDKVLNDNLYEMGIMEFQTPDIVEIHGISTVSPLYYKSESATTLYNTENDTIVLDNSIKTVEDLYAAFAENYKDTSGKDASTTAASIATWLTIKDNQYNKAFEGKINNDGDRTDLMLLQTLSELGDGETLELKLPQTFGVNITASGLNIEDVSVNDAYHIVHEMTPTASSFTLDGSKKVMSDEDTAGLYDFVDIATMYSDPDTLETYATKEKDENGNYVFQYNLNVADLNAKTYSLYEQFAYDHMDFFAAKQNIDIDGESKEYEFGVFDVKEGYEDVVNDLIKEGDYDTAKQYLTFNLDRFISGSFYNEDGTLKTGGDLTMSLEQYFYVNDGEGKTISMPDKTPDKEDDKVPDSDNDTESDSDVITDSDVDTESDSTVDTDDTDDSDDSNVDTDDSDDSNVDTDDTDDSDDSNVDTDDTDDSDDSNVDTDDTDDSDDSNVDTDDTDDSDDSNVDTDDTDDSDDSNVDTDDTDDSDDSNVDTDDTDDSDDSNVDTDDTDDSDDSNVDTDDSEDSEDSDDSDVDTDKPNPDPPIDTDTDSDDSDDSNVDTDDSDDSNIDTDDSDDSNVDTDDSEDSDDSNVDTDDTDGGDDSDVDTDKPNPDPPIDTDTDSDDSDVDTDDTDDSNIDTDDSDDSNVDTDDSEDSNVDTDDTDGGDDSNVDTDDSDDSNVDTDDSEDSDDSDVDTDDSEDSDDSNVDTDDSDDSNVDTDDSDGGDDCEDEDPVMPDMDGGLTEGQVTPDSGNQGNASGDSENKDDTTTDSGNQDNVSGDSGNQGNVGNDAPCEDEDNVAPDVGVITETVEQSQPAPQETVQDAAPTQVQSEPAPASQETVQDAAPTQVQSEPAPAPAPAETSNDSSQSEATASPISDEEMGGESGAELDW